MASGLPTIVSRTCGVGEALQHVLRAGHDETEELAGLILALLEAPSLREPRRAGIIHGPTYTSGEVSG